MGDDVTLGHCTYIGHRNNTVPTSISIGEGTSIGAFCVIKNNVTIGRRVRLGDYVAIEEGAVIGDDTRILYRAHIHEGAIVGRRCVIGSDVIDRCLIEDDVTFMGDMVHAHKDPTQDWDTTEEPSPTILRGTVVGVRALLIGPVSIGPGSYIGAGEIVRASVRSNYAVLSGQTIPLRHCPFIKSRLNSRERERKHGNTT
jgi:serine acetyltransferase